VNVAAEIDSGYKLQLEKIATNLKVTEILSKFVNCLKFLEILNFLREDMMKVPTQRKWV